MDNVHEVYKVKDQERLSLQAKRDTEGATAGGRPELDELELELLAAETEADTEAGANRRS